MYNNWSDDLSDSVVALESIKDTILPQLIRGKIHTIESSKNDVLILLDTLSGIDYIREDDKGLQGVAARCQWGTKKWGAKRWDTFTIRYKRHSGTETEYSKRLKQINGGYFYPAFTLQAYFVDKKNNECLSCGIMKTVDLYDFIEENPDMVGSNKSDNDFIFVKWDDIKDIKPMKIWPKT